MDDIIEKIDSDKEILSTMPKNTKKNISLYIEQLEKLETEYEKEKKDVFKELKSRYDSIINIKENKEINELEVQIKEIEDMFEIIGTTKTSYEKMNLDKTIYKLGRFYKENLENINEEILLCINKFNEVGINLTSNDFDYSVYVNEYMQIFFEEAKKENVNSDIMKTKFEEIYWKCPDIIIHIELNLRYIYIVNQKSIDKYFEKRKNDLLFTINMKQTEIQDKYVELNKKLLNEKDSDKFKIINSFLNGKLNAKDYEDDKIQDKYKMLLEDDALNNNKLEETNENITKFKNSLSEYENYVKFQFIFEDIKKKYIEREQHKNEYNTIKKEITGKEKKLKGLNKKINGKGLFGKRKEKNEKQNAQYNTLVLDIKADYKKLDKAELYSKIIEKLSDNSTIYDVLEFAISFNVYLTECIIEKDPSIEPKDIEELINDLEKFLKNPYNIITKNITILEEKDIPMIISDRYKLLNFKILKDDINVDNAISLIQTLTAIELKQNMIKEKISINEMEFIGEFKKILNKV